MRARTWAVAAAALALAATGAWWSTRDHGSTTTRAAARATAPAARAPLATGAPRSPLAPRVAVHDVADVGDEAPDRAPVVIEPGQRLAEVNGVAITLADLMAVEPDAGAQRLAPTALRYLLDRAIDRELVAQAARAAGVTLDAARQEQLAAVRDQSTSPPPDAVADLTRTPAYVAFDVRDTEGLLLQAELAARAAAASPPALPAADDDEDDLAAAEAAGVELPTDPAAREAAARDLVALAPARRHASAVAALMRDLRARATIRESVPVAALP